MKTVVLSFFAALALASLLGCHNQQQAMQSPVLEPMQQSYSGALPCGPTCKDSESSLFLAADGSYVLEQRVSGKSPLHIAQYGKWARTADTLTLVAANGEKQLFRPTDNGLEAIAWHGVAINNPHDYLLKVNNRQPL